ncbi:uncharacterized protein LOC126418579 [Schistocerca serialis cubense]|uniref:uncharacterized protein LOC126418579 n=1 Tax=Schistocerca serialis cubense TaxID=2023355 RepID=UPI00214F4768|nr:uncharacterized protein LOC126418579 [Schistocerca serialis cubense]
MGSPLSPVIANFFMEKFEEQALGTASKKQNVWFRYMDDTFVLWRHGREELSRFHEHLNSINSRIQFTMEEVVDGKLHFLDVLVFRNENGSLGHSVYRKPTHTDRYLHRDSNHHPQQKRGVIKTLADRARNICKPELLDAEMEHLHNALMKNGYLSPEIKRALRQPRRNHTDVQATAKSKVFLPFVKNVTERIGRILTKRNITVIYKPTRKIQEYLKPAKDTRKPLEKAGVYRIPCSCGDVYVGTTKRTVSKRLEEHKGNCRRGETERSAVAEHAFQPGNHNIRFEETPQAGITKGSTGRQSESLTPK